jgi:hypothetical protein
MVACRSGGPNWRRALIKEHLPRSFRWDIMYGSVVFVNNGITWYYISF